MSRRHSNDDEDDLVLAINRPKGLRRDQMPLMPRRRGWNSARYADLFERKAKEWRASQEWFGGVTPLDEMQVRVLELTAKYYGLLAMRDAGVIVPDDDLKVIATDWNREVDNIVFETKMGME